MFCVWGRSIGLFVSRTPRQRARLFLLCSPAMAAISPARRTSRPGRTPNSRLALRSLDRLGRSTRVMTVAPFGALTEDGAEAARHRRLRGVPIFGRCAQRGRRRARQIPRHRLIRRPAGRLSPATRALTLKLYAGAMASRHMIDPFDPEAEVQGSGIGGKTVLETWWTLSEHAWARSMCRTARCTTPMAAGCGSAGEWCRRSVDRHRGRRRTATSMGDSGRIGAFVRYEWAQGEVSASGGLMTDWAGIEKIDARGAYATISWMNRF